MKKILDFSGFINESTAAGNRDHTFEVPFKFSSNDPKYGYNSKSFVDDLKAVFLEKPRMKEEILKFLKDVSIYNIDDLGAKPFSFVSQLIPEIERIIEAGDYKPDAIMPGGAILFIRDKKIEGGKMADFYLNNRGTKIEVVTDDQNGKDSVLRFHVEDFPYDQFDFTKEEKEELEALVKAKGYY
jgi:hypothetical protein